MCMLYGFFTEDFDAAKESFLDNFLAGLSKIDLRGEDNFALSIATNQGFIKHKFSSKSLLINFLNVNASKLSGKAISIQVVARAIPSTEMVTGAISKSDMQPFYSDRFLVSHNGVISNDAELAIQYNIDRGFTKVDSYIVPYVFEKEGVHKNLFRIFKGSYAFSIVERVSNGLRFYLATNFMPLWFISSKGWLVYSSDVSSFDGFEEKIFAKEMESYSLLEWHNGKFIIDVEKGDLSDDKVLVICSGGLDSTTTLRLYQVLGKEVVLLYFKYGQRADEVENWAVRQISNRFNIPLIELDINSTFDMFTGISVLRNSDKTVLDNIADRLQDSEQTISYVGARNAIFSVLTMALAEKLRFGKIALGLNLDDSSAYPDNTIGFLRSLENLSGYALDWLHKVAVRAPFVHLTKKEIIEVGIDIGTPFDLQPSCRYPKLTTDGKIVYCGKCGSDLTREYAWKRLGFKDPIEYEGDINRWQGYINFEDSVEYSKWVERSASKLLLSLDDIRHSDRFYL